jgi:CheY-like chemotaxis protein
LRDRFVFLTSKTPVEPHEFVEGSCVFIAPDSLDEIVRAVESAIARVRKSARSRSDIHDLEWVESDAPTLLLVEDEPLQLSFMVRLFRDLGFSVTPAESGNAAIALLSTREFDVMLSDWYMPDGSGADLYQWVVEHRPHLLGRCFFMSGGVGAHALASAPPGCLVLPKGQDSEALVQTLIEAVQGIRGLR